MPRKGEGSAQTGIKWSHRHQCNKERSCAPNQRVCYDMKVEADGRKEDSDLLNGSSDVRRNSTRENAAEFQP